MDKKVAMAILILLSTALITSLFASGGAKGQDLGTLFSDHFDGAVLDEAKWLAQSNGGSVTVADSYVYLTSDGSGFPLVTSAVNPFPLAGDFALEFDIQYTRIEDSGTGFWVSQGPFVPSENNLNANVMQVWAGVDRGVGTLFVNFLGDSVHESEYHWNPFGPLNSSVLTFRLQFNKDLYTLYLNGDVLASKKSSLRPDTIGFGHPPAYWVPGPSAAPWTSFKINSIRLLQPASISLATTPSAIGLGLNVDMTGTLTDPNGLPLQGTEVTLSYQIPSEQKWNTLTSVITNDQGSYTATWLPQATGNFLVKAEWNGDATYAGTFETKNVSITRGSAGDTLFVAESNSTLSSLAFNSGSNDISFTVSGPSGTSGYTRFIISKETFPNMTGLKVYVDMNQPEYSVSETSHSWILYFEYTHSSHDVIVAIPKSSHNQIQSLEPFTTTLLAAAAASVIIAGAGLSIYFKKRKR